MTNGKTFNTGATAELLISGADRADDGQQTKQAPAQTIDPHAEEREQERHLQELREQAAKLEQQAKAIKQEATMAKRQAIAAANARYKGASTTKYRAKPDFMNPRTRRVQLMLRPAVYDRAKEYCEANAVSFNTFIELATLAFLDGGNK